LGGGGGGGGLFGYKIYLQLILVTVILHNEAIPSCKLLQEVK